MLSTMGLMFVIAFGAMLAVIAAMAVGPMFGRPAIKGSCGGLNVSGECDICGGDPAACDTDAPKRSGPAFFDDLAEPATFDPMAEPKRRS